MRSGDTNSPDFLQNTLDSCGTESDRFLILHNDEIHSFDYVVEALVEVCSHNPEQAEQCAYIAHLKGRCDVRKGSSAYLHTLLKALSEKGLTVTLE